MGLNFWAVILYPSKNSNPIFFIPNNTYYVISRQFWLHGRMTMMTRPIYSIINNGLPPQILCGNNNCFFFLCLRRSCVWCLACTTMYVYSEKKKMIWIFDHWWFVINFFFMSKNEQKNKANLIKWMIIPFFFSTQTFLPTKKYLYQIRVYQKVLNYLGIIYMMSF